MYGILFHFLMYHITLTQASLEGLKKGYGNILKDSVGTDVDIIYGEIPKWINGIFVHHTCGAFGDIDNHVTGGHVSHIFDCLTMGQSFKFQNGKVTFYNRYFDTVTTDIYKSYDMNMTLSTVFWRTAYTAFDKEAVLKHEADFSKTDSKKPNMVPHVKWWNINNKAIACGEGMREVQIDVHSMEVIKDYHFKDNNFGYDGDHFFIMNNAECWDSDDIIWSSTMVLLPNWWKFTAKQWRLVYKIIDEVRIPVAEIPYPDLSPFYCDGKKPYSDPKARMPYLHSFAATENYIILPETSYLFEPCAVMDYIKNKDVPFHKVGFNFEKNVQSIIRVIRKSDGREMAAIEIEAFFVTHQINAYEEGGFIFADMLTFEDAALYTEHTYVNKAINGSGFESYIHRLVINMENWTLTRRENFYPQALHFEEPHVKTDIMGHKYKYAYFCEGIYYDKPQVIHKINWDNREDKTYAFDEDIYPQEPWFLPTPGGIEEDDGVLLVLGFDGKKEKGFLMVLDAKTMEPIAFALAQDMVLFGFHVNFFSLETEQKHEALVNDQNDENC